MSDLREAAEMALEALEMTADKFQVQRNAITELRQALAQPEQEPETVMAKYEFQTYAAYKDDGEIKIGVVPEHTAWVTAGEHTVPLEVAPVDAVNMSQERVDETAKDRHEPVAWFSDRYGKYVYCEDMTDYPTHEENGWKPLYTAPPKREWVGLSSLDKTFLRTAYAQLRPLYHDKKEDVSVAAEVVTDWDAFFAAINDMLKEKNLG